MSKNTVGISRTELFDNQKLLNYQELADWLGVSVSFCQKAVHTRDIPFVKVGQQVRFSKQEVWCYLNKE